MVDHRMGPGPRGSPGSSTRRRGTPIPGPVFIMISNFRAEAQGHDEISNRPPARPPGPRPAAVTETGSGLRLTESARVPSQCRRLSLPSHCDRGIMIRQSQLESAGLVSQ
jgi:hypothetical protein